MSVSWMLSLSSLSRLTAGLECGLCKVVTEGTPRYSGGVAYLIAFPTSSHSSLTNSMESIRGKMRSRVRAMINAGPYSVGLSPAANSVRAQSVHEAADPTSGVISGLVGGALKLFI